MEHGSRGLRAHLAALVVGLVVSATAAPSPAPGAVAATNDVLVAGAGPVTTAQGPVVRSRPVEVDPASLDPDGGRVRMHLFDDVSVAAAVEPSPSGVAGWAGWTGTVDGDADSTVDIVSDGELVSAVVVTGGRSYRVVPGPGGGIEAREVRPGHHREDSDDAVISTGDSMAAAGTAVPSAGQTTEADLPGPPTADLLVVYTPSALSRAGGRAAFDAATAQAIQVFNSALATSEVRGRIRLAGTYAIGENATTDDIYRLRDPGDGYADGIHRERERIGADLVTVIGGDLGGGVAFQPVSHDWLANPEDKFSVVDYDGMVDAFFLPHEVGHNMGLDHDRYVTPPGSPVLYPFAYGYVHVPGRWRTIMSYYTECEDRGVPGHLCVELPRFANPDLTHDGVPTGRPHTALDAADSRRALNLTFPVIADLLSTPHPFSTWSRFLQQQARDLQFGASLPPATVTWLSAQLASGQLKPAVHVEALMRGPFATAHAPVVRLYSAYFLRRPDIGGLDYWVGHYRSGTSVNQMSQYFSGTPEFRDRYGTLTNRGFVQLVYRNVLGRPGETAGVDYWTGVLDRRERNRGQVMVGFSESPENKTATARSVDVVMLHRALLARMPTAAELATAVDRLASGSATVRRLILEIMATPAYSARVTT